MLDPNKSFQMFTNKDRIIDTLIYKKRIKMDDL